MARQRRPKGDGYLSFDKRRGQWRATVPQPDGTTKTRYFAKADKKAADAWRRGQVDIAHQPPPPAPPRPRLTIAEALAEMLAGRDYQAPSTQMNNDTRARHIIAALGTFTPDAVTAYDVARLDASLRDGRAAATVEQVITLLGMLYKRLIALKVVDYNPVAAFRTITPLGGRGGAELRQPIALDPGMCRRILAALVGNPYHAPIAWMITLGLRSGEARGLRWANVRDDEVAIVEQRRQGDRYTPADLKTKASPRVLPLPAALLALTPRIGDDLVFPNPNGGAIGDYSIRRALRRACVAAKVPIVRIHDLRHTCGAGLRRDLCPFDYVRTIMGHEGETQTEHYAQIDAAALRPWVEQWAGKVLQTQSDSRAQTA